MVPPLARRTLLQCLAGLTLARGTGTAPAAAGDRLAARCADAFVGSVGANIHLSSPPYATHFARFRALLGASGIRHLRDELRPGDDLARWRDLHRSCGILAQFLVSPVTNTPAQMMDYLARLGTGMVAAVEGQNEGDSPWFMAQPAARGGWAPAVVAYQAAVFRTLRASPATATLPVVSPSVIDWKPSDMRLLAAAAEHCDIVSLHAYAQHGEPPETGSPYAGLSWYIRAERDPFKPGAAVMVTEAGYHTLAGRKGRPLSAGVSERAAARYLPRLLLHNFDAGVLRSFVYEFMDESDDPADDEQHYGLVRHDGTPKPAYGAVRTLLRALHDPGPPFVPGHLNISLAAPCEDLRRVLLQKRDGRFYLALWRATPSWDAMWRRDATVAPVPVTIVAHDPIGAAATMTPDDGDRWMSCPRADRITVNVADAVTLLRIAPRRR